MTDADAAPRAGMLSGAERASRYANLVLATNVRDEHFELFGMKGLKVECPVTAAK